MVEKMKAVLKFLTDKVWPLTVAVLAFIVINWAPIRSLVQGELDEAGGEFTWDSLLVIAAGLIAMARVYSKDSAEKLAASMPHELGRPHNAEEVTE
jgi:di/tricarboxylate transporter